jgi:hypothetical protein
MRERIRDRKGNAAFAAACAAMIVMASFLWTILSGYLYQAEQYILYRNLILAALMSLLIFFSFTVSFGNNHLFSWNIGKIQRFSAMVCIAIVFLAGAGQVPFLAMPVSGLAIMLTVFSGGSCGIISYGVLILQYCMINNLDVGHMIVLLVTGFAGAVLFAGINHDFLYAGSLFAYLVSDFVCYSLFYVMIQQGQNLGDALLYTGIRLFSALIWMLILFKILGNCCIYKDDNVFAVINDPEYRLLTELKKVDKDAYVHAVHVAYLSDKMARKIGANAPLAKAGGYYHKIGLLQGKDTLQNTILVGTANRFPRILLRLLKECSANNISGVSKEAAIVQLSDALVSSVTYLFDKDKNATLNYEKIIDVIIRKKMDSGDFEHCSLTIEELCLIKKGFAEEKLYYDFLR